MGMGIEITLKCWRRETESLFEQQREAGLGKHSNVHGDGISL